MTASINPTTSTVLYLGAGCLAGPVTKPWKAVLTRLVQKPHLERPINSYSSYSLSTAYHQTRRRYWGGSVEDEYESVEMKEDGERWRNRVKQMDTCGFKGCTIGQSTQLEEEEEEEEGGRKKEEIKEGGQAGREGKEALSESSTQRIMHASHSLFLPRRCIYPCSASSHVPRCQCVHGGTHLPLPDCPVLSALEYSPSATSPPKTTHPHTCTLTHPPGIQSLQVLHVGFLEQFSAHHSRAPRCMPSTK